MCDSPIDEGGHPSTLDAYCECYQNRGGAGLAKKVHCSSHCWPASLEAKSAPVYSETTRDSLPRTTQLPNALRWVIAFHTIAFAAIVVSKPIPNKTTFLPALAKMSASGCSPQSEAAGSPRSQSHQNPCARNSAAQLADDASTNDCDPPYRFLQFHVVFFLPANLNPVA
jgi:hypothetical protein